MPRTRSRRKSSPRRARNIAPVPQLAIVPAPEKPVRGVKLKTVSRFAMVFALLCLGAFIAGRPPVSAPDPVKSRTLSLGMKIHNPSLSIPAGGREDRIF